MRSMQSEKNKSALGPSELYVLAMLREVIAISKAESQSARGDVGSHSYESQQSKPPGNTGHDEEGYRALMGYV